MHWYGAIGELTTDLAALALLYDVAPFLIAFILLFRLFDYIREGFAIDPMHAWVNQDYDSLAGALLFQGLSASGILSRTRAGYHLELDNIREFSYQLLTELHELGINLLQLSRAGQTTQIELTVHEYFAQHLECASRERFLLSSDHRMFLKKAAHLPLKPSWEAIEKRYKLQHFLKIEKWRS